jgi:ribonuclease E
MSRQRIRASVLESSTEPCPHCGGSGHVRSVSSVALQLLRGLEEILMKGATHNLVVRTRTDVALYVLNHKRGHLRDLENSFKVSLAVIADPSVSGQQSFVIDRGEQVHTLEAAKALLASQAAANPSQGDEPSDDEERFDIEVESEVETDETEGLTDEAAALDETASELSTDGQRRRRRRRRRGRGGEVRDGGVPRDENGLARNAPGPAEAAGADEINSDEEESEERPSQARPDQATAGERRPRRRGRRGGRRRRGGVEDGLAGSIVDELEPTAAPEAASAVADFDGYSSQPAPFAVHQETDDARPVQETVDRAAPDVSHPSAETEMQEAERAAARRRSTVREKVSFLANAQPDVAAPASQGQPEPAAASAPATAPDPVPQPASESTAAAQPRRAGWWSRRFGGGE